MKSIMEVEWPEQVNVVDEVGTDFLFKDGKPCCALGLAMDACGIKQNLVPWYQVVSWLNTEVGRTWSANYLKVAGLSGGGGVFNGIGEINNRLSAAERVRCYNEAWAACGYEVTND